jgi:hypothetical protein
LKEKLLYAAAFALFVVGVFYLYFSSAEQYSKQSLERLELCLKHSTENNESSALCGHIEMSAHAAYFSASQESGLLNTLVILMFGGFSILAYKVRSLSRELDELKSNSNA